MLAPQTPGMRTKLLAVGMVVALVTTTFGVSAFTSASMSRTSNVDIVTDDKGLIALEDGTSGHLIYQNSTGALEIDLTNGSAQGANVHAHFEFGNPNDPHNQTAFNITNQDAESHSITLDYTGEASNTDGEVDLKFEVYKPGASSPTATLTDESGSVTVSSVGSGTTLHVVMIIDTEDDSGEDLTGTLDVSA